MQKMKAQCALRLSDKSTPRIVAPLRTLLPVLLSGFLAVLATQFAAAEPIADVHVHYKWNQKEVTSPEDAIHTLHSNDVILAVVIGTPAHYALELQALSPGIIVPVWSPYETPGDWSTWPFDKNVLARARNALASGEYRGIGELHLIGGFAPDWKSPVISGLLKLAGEYDVPVILHTEISRAGYVGELCAAFPDVRIQWAHAGAILSADAVSDVMQACPNVWAELAARDTWRFVGNPIVDQTGALLPAWRGLIEAFPDRIVVGSDPVWPVDKLDSWEEPDSGWLKYAQFIDFHRTWIDRLPADISRKIRLENAQSLFTQPK